MRLVSLSPDLILTTDIGVIETSGVLERYYVRVASGGALEPVYVVDGRGVTSRPFYLEEQKRLLRDIDLGHGPHADSFLKGRVYVDNVQASMEYAEGLIEKRVASLEALVREKPWLLLDGNHRALACSLARRDVPCAVLESDDDVAEARFRYQEGKVPQAFSQGVTLLDAVRAWESYVLGTASSRFGEAEARTCSVSERRDWLFERRGIPAGIVAHIDGSGQ